MADYTSQVCELKAAKWNQNL